MIKQKPLTGRSGARSVWLRTRNHIRSDLTKMKIDSLEDIRDIFSIFHDGCIVASALQGEALMLDIDIQYLSEKISPEFNGFTVSLYGFTNASFSTWPSDLKSEPEVIRNISVIFNPELEILEASLSQNKVVVICNQHSSKYDYCGGELSFNITSAEVKDPSGKSYTISELDDLCNSYWDEWKARRK